MEADMMTAFTPIQSLLGGAMIGLAAVILMLALGRIAGISGILASLLPPNAARDWGWRTAFLGGLVLSPLLVFNLTDFQVDFQSEASAIALIISGTIAGVGLAFSSGCTSGHGVCGLARLSPRSLAATVTFMGFTFAGVLLSRHLLG